MELGDKASEPTRTELEVKPDKDGAFYVDDEFNPVSSSEYRVMMDEYGKYGLVLREKDATVAFFTDTADYDKGKHLMAEALMGYMADLAVSYGSILKILMDKMGVNLSSEEDSEYINSVFVGDFKKFVIDMSYKILDIMLESFQSAFASASKPFMDAIHVLTGDKSKTSPSNPMGKDGLIFKALGL